MARTVLGCRPKICCFLGKKALNVRLYIVLRSSLHATNTTSKKILKKRLFSIETLVKPTNKPETERRVKEHVRRKHRRRSLAGQTHIVTPMAPPPKKATAFSPWIVGLCTRQEVEKVTLNIHGQQMGCQGRK
jgi:hypothetical protein